LKKTSAAVTRVKSAVDGVRIIGRNDGKPLVPIRLPCPGDQQPVERRSKSEAPSQPFAHADEPEHDKCGYEILPGKRKALTCLADENRNIAPKIAGGDDDNDT